MINSSKIAAVIVLGPGAKELDRLHDVLDALRCYAPDVSPVLVLNDGNNPTAINEALTRHKLEGFEFPNPRAGQGSFWLGRMTFGLACVYRFISQHYQGHHVLRLDSDALIVGTFVPRLIAQLESRTNVGLVGSVGLVSPTIQNNAEWHDWRTRVYRMSKPFSRWDKAPFFRCNLFGAAAAMRSLILKAATNGYPWGYQANGGAYLITAEALARLPLLAELNSDSLTSNNWVTEDVFYAIVIYAVGLVISEEQNPGDVFGSCWKGLLGRTLDEVAARNNAIIHSVKDHGPFQEETTRDYFRHRRAMLRSG